MFSPNAYNIRLEDVNMHHRGEEFRKVLFEIRAIFLKKFNIPETHDFFIFNGSGSQTMEKLLQSLSVNVNFDSGPGKFLERWRNYSSFYREVGAPEVNGCVQFETSISSYFDCNRVSVVDAVCAFPYYSLPLEADFVVTVSSKILAAAPVLGIVIYRKEAIDKINGDVPSSMLNWVEYDKYGQTPFTPAIPLYVSLLSSLRDFDLEKVRMKVRDVSDFIVDVFGEDAVVGDLRAPAISVNKKFVNLKRCMDLNLYGTHNNSEAIQIFTYSHDISDYERIIPYLKK